MPEQPQPRTWSEIAAGLPQDLPQEHYDQARKQYFDQVVAPRLSKESNPIATWKEFKQQTERPSIPHAGIKGFAAGAATGLLKPLKPIIPSVVRDLEQTKTKLSRDAPVATGVGEFAGEVASYGAVAAVIPELGTSRLAQAAHSTAAFAAFEALAAEPGNRVAAGARGAVAGAAFEGALGLAGKLISRGVPKGEVDEIVRKSLSGEGAPAPIDEVIEQHVKQEAEASRKEMRPGILREDAKTRGIQVYLRDAEGKPLPALRVMEGKENQAIDQIKAMINNGAGVEAISYHPDAQARLQKFLRSTADQSAGDYTGFKIVKTQEGQAKAVASEMKMNDTPATAVSESEVVVQTKHGTKPDRGTLGNHLEQLKDSEGYGLSKGAKLQIERQVSALWDENVPARTKEMIADQVKQWDLKGLIPPEFERAKELAEAAEPPTAVKVEKTVDEQILERAEELGLTEAEVTRLEEITGRTKEARVSAVSSVTEESARKGELPRIDAVGRRIPLSERTEASIDERGVKWSKEPAELGESERRFAVKVPTEDIESTVPGAAAFTAGPKTKYGGSGLADILDFMGYDIEKAFGEDFSRMPKDKPTIVYDSQVSRGTIYHENLHVDKYHIPNGDKLIAGLGKELPPDVLRTKVDVARALGDFRAYRKSPVDHLFEEAYVHTATAFREGDLDYLHRLASYDTSIDHLAEMVHAISENLLEAARTGVDSAPARIVQRKMQDLIRRTSIDRMWELKEGVKFTQGDLFPTSEEAWQFVSQDGTQHTITGGVKEVNDFLEKQLGTEFAPSASLWAEARGVRGPMTPRGGSPSGPDGLPSAPDNVKWAGWTTISGLFRPFFPWIADADGRINEALSKYGKHLPLYDRAKDVDDAFKLRMVKEDEWRDKVIPLLSGLGKKQLDMFQLLATDPQHWDEMARRLKLDEKQVANAHALEDWMKDFRQETNVNPFNYLRDEYPRLRSFGYNLDRVYGSFDKTKAQMSFFERAIKEGHLDPKSQHLGSFVDFLMRRGLAEKYTDKPIAELESLIGKKAKDGSYILGNTRLPVENYVKYMRGIPDVTGQVMNKSVADFQQFLGKRAAEMNKHLPDWAQLPTEFQYPGAIINKMMVWSYAAGLGLRASIPIRDTLQVFSTGLPVMGPKRFLLGLEKGVTGEGFKFAQESGALLSRHNVGELYGDIFSELPAGASNDRLTQIAQKLLSPSRWGHNGARSVVFNGEYHSALEAIRGYRAGRVDLDKLITDHTSLWWNDKPARDRMLQLVQDRHVPPEEAAKQIALEVLDLTLWPYRRGTQPMALRTGAGRILGQFGMWPMNYLDFLRRGATKYAEYPSKSLQTTALWAASNYAATSAMEGMGIDSGKWFFVSPAGYGLSPHAQFVLDLAKAPEETEDGRAARKRVLEYPLDFFPSGVELQNIAKVVDSGETPFDSDGHPTPALLQVLGFRPLKEDEPDRDFEEQLRHEFGLGGRQR